jgi:hypothetical protein
MAWVARVADDYRNLRAALAWSRTHGDVEALARMAAALPVYWNIHGPNGEGEALLDTVLEADRDLPSVLRAKVLWARTLLATWNFDVVTSTLRAQEGVSLAKRMGDDLLTARFLSALGQASWLTGRPDSTVDDAINLARQVGDPWALAGGLYVQGGIRLLQDPRGADLCFEEGRRVAEAAGNLAVANIAAGARAGALWYQGELLRAWALCDQVAAAAEALGDRTTVAMTVMYSGLVASEADRRDEALGFADQLERMAAELDMRLWKPYVPLVRGQIALANGDPRTALRLTREAADLAQVPLIRANTLPALIEAELADGLGDDARTHVEELSTLGEAVSATTCPGLSCFGPCWPALRENRLPARPSPTRR